MKIVGLTGTIGSGKSTVSTFLKNNGIKIVDADEISRSITKKDVVLSEIINCFGNEILDDKNELDRKKLGDIVFNDKDKLNNLNQITHKYIIDKIKYEINSHKKAFEKLIVLDAPLLIEANLLEYVDYVLLVICSEEIQIKRIIDRDNINEKDAKLRINAQMSYEEKLKYADFVIDNSYDLEYLKSQITKFILWLEDTGIE